MNPDQQAVSPTQTTVRLEVSQSVFERLKDRDTALIYYSPTSPLTFLLEEEI